jgi:hypothetical protein
MRDEGEQASLARPGATLGSAVAARCARDWSVVPVRVGLGRSYGALGALCRRGAARRD